MGRHRRGRLKPKHPDDAWPKEVQSHHVVRAWWDRQWMKCPNCSCPRVAPRFLYHSAHTGRWYRFHSGGKEHMSWTRFYQLQDVDYLPQGYDLVAICHHPWHTEKDRKPVPADLTPHKAGWPPLSPERAVEVAQRTAERRARSRARVGKGRR